jgi:hypothetical protein
MTRQGSKVSDEILMSFMDRIEKSVDNIKKIVGDVSIRVATLETKEDIREKLEIKKAILITIIMFMIGTIGGLLGYIWGKEQRNERIQESIESSHSRSEEVREGISFNWKDRFGV